MNSTSVTQFPHPQKINLSDFIRRLLGEKKWVYGCLRHGVFATPTAVDADTVIVVEGPMDALTLATCGFPAVALCGTTCPDWMPSVIASKILIIASDADTAGDRLAAILSGRFAGYAKKCIRMRPPPPYKDWNEMIQEIGMVQLRDGLHSVSFLAQKSRRVS